MSVGQHCKPELLLYNMCYSEELQASLNQEGVKCDVPALNTTADAVNSKSLCKCS